MDEKIQSIVKFLKQSKNTVVLTGAGISTESGIPCYREGKKERLINNKTLQEVSNSNTKLDDSDFISYYREMYNFVNNNKPNQAHKYLDEWKDKGIVTTILTQNVDGYHKKAIELHGNINKFYCSKCGKKYSGKDYSNFNLCNHIDFSFEQGGYTKCSGLLRPDVVLFNEQPKNLKDALMEINMADLVMVVGTSLKVSPVNLLPFMAKEKGAKLVVINKDMLNEDIDKFFDIKIYRENITDVFEKINKYI